MKPFHHKFASAFGVVICLALVLGTCCLSPTALAAPAVRFPALSEDAKGSISKSGVDINYGNSADGYVMVRGEAIEKKYKLRISKDGTTYTYDLNNQGEYEVFPLQMGDGTYKVEVFKQAAGSKYASACAHSVKVKLADPNNPYLFPNQFCMYTADSQTVAMSFTLCDGLTTDAEKVKAVYDYLTKNLIYDFVRATTVQKGYLPKVDAVLAEKKGICFDYSAVMACMLRVQNIPTQLVVGDADKNYHAWNLVLVDGKWEHYDSTFAAAKLKVKKYTETGHY